MNSVTIGDATLYLGDVLSVLAEIPDESVHCVVTSPPYWGLRDYGTGTWEGGSAECDHKAANRAGVSATVGNTLTGESDFYRTLCGKCGARRIDQQIGLEETPEQYVAKMVAVFRAVRRVLRADGTCWVNLGDSYAGSGKGPTGHNGIQGDASCGVRIGSVNGDSGHTSGVTPPPGLKAKDLVGIPWRVAFALQADGWYLRSDIIWSKPNPMPESVTDRPTKAHEYLFLLSKSARYFYDADAVREEHVRLWNENNGGSISTGRMVDAGGAMGDMSSHPKGYPLPNPAGRNRRTVWTIATEPFPGAHFATFPRKLVSPCILAGCPEHACPKCGAPWVREVERDKYEPTIVAAGERNVDPSRGDKTRKINGKSKEFREAMASARTIGEHPTCACGLAPIGGTVLDPFGGSGTTAEVALEYGRKAILIELKPEYVELAKRRLAPVAGRPMLNFAGAQKE